ncbi:hypothetical protein C0Q70_19408 [Pomacea canaliculata]|uniref:Uncharacterized protein n=1 Tax=Pomacea canaliculata TaxID=400727 RepID=A0A2T7NJ93_POMCA|nr:hypothetical protein C0Q70_19408 [Pomacea canaliculata]
MPRSVHKPSGLAASGSQDAVEISWNEWELGSTQTQGSQVTHRPTLCWEDTCAKSKEQRMVAIILFHFLSFRVFFSEEPGCTFGDTKHYMG